MTKEKEVFIERHHKIVGSFLKKRGLDEREYYDVVIFAFLSAVDDYFTKEELREKYVFEQIASQRMKYAYWANLRYETRGVRYPKPISLNQSGEVDGADYAIPDSVCWIMEDENIRELVSIFTEREKEVVRLRLLGYRTCEIAEQCGITVQGVHSRLYRLRRKIRYNYPTNRLVCA